MIYKLDGYIFKAQSKKRNNAKYDVFDESTKKYITSFGGLYPDGTPYDQFEDKIGHYSKYDHKDYMRRKAYYLRHGRDADYESAKWFSHQYLW